MNKDIFSLCRLALGLAMMASLPATAQELTLYPTGPTADSSFVRFIDGTTGDVTVTSASGVAKLTVQQPSTPFSPVPAKWQVKVQLQQGDRVRPVELQVQPGEFVSVVALSSTDGLAAKVLREVPDDFNGFKTSIGFANAAGSACVDAALTLAGSDVSVFAAIAPDTFERRLINPVRLVLQLTCAGKPAGTALDLGQLEAGERYSLLAVPDAANARLIFTHDKMVP